MSELIDREAVREFIKSYRNSTDVAFHMEDHLDEIPAASPWRRVEDGLPPYGQDVLAARLYGADVDGWAHEIIIAHICNIRDSVYWNATNVTHWMPLPEPPKEDA